MATLKDYGIRFISHGEWSDPEIEWKKSDFQTLLFNYWDVAECTEYEKLRGSSDDADLQEIVAQLWELTPDGYARPKIDYEWEIRDGNIYEFYDDSVYYEDARLSWRDDFVLHNTSQALRQALEAADAVDEKNCEIRIYRRENGKHSLAAIYALRGSVLKDLLH